MKRKTKALLHSVNPWRITVQPPPADPVYALMWSPTAQRVGREGMVTVWDERGRFVGCMGAEFWESLLTERMK